MNNFTDFRGPAWASRISNEVAQRSIQVTTGQWSSANDMPDMYYDLLQILFQRKSNWVLSGGSSGRVRGGEKHEIYAAAFSSHLFMTYFHRARGAMAPSTPLPPPPDPLLVLDKYLVSIQQFNRIR